MAKDRRKLLHIHSSVPDKQPTAASLEVGEIAVNNAKDQEFLSLKNSDNKVVRFSSDEQIVTIMEKKEVMPYKGYVRGETGPSSTSGDSPTADTYGSYGITNNDLLNNKSNIVVKLNQVVADNTIKHNKVNGAKDVYNKEVNPTNDSGLTDGAGFFIDMSRYAMQGANPSFSSITTTCNATLNGSTTIKGTTGTCGSKLDVNVTNENHTANTFNVSSTTACVLATNSASMGGDVTTNLGTDCAGNAISNTTNIYGDIINESGNTINTTANTSYNLSAKTYNLSAQTANTTANTYYVSSVTETHDTKNFTVNATSAACVIADVSASIGGDVNTNVGTNCAGTAISNITNIYGDTINESANTYNLSANTANTVVKVDNITANTYNLSAQTANTTANTINTSANTINTTATTEYNLTAKTYNLSAQTANTTANTYNVTAKTENHNNEFFNVTATSAFNVTTSAACIVASNTASMGGDVNTNVGTNCAGTAISNITNIYGDTINESGDTINTTANTYNLSAKTENHNNEYFNVTATSAFNVSTSAACINANNSANIGGASATTIGKDCAGTSSHTTNIFGEEINNYSSSYTVNASAACINASSTASFGGLSATTIGEDCGGNTSDVTNVYGDTINVSGDTFNVSGDTHFNNEVYFTQEIHIASGHGFDTSICWKYGDARNAVSGCTNMSGDTEFVIPKSVDDLTNWDGSCITLPHDVCVTGKVTASNGFFQSSDRNLKENIERPNFDKFSGANKTPIKKFNYINDETKRDTYGVIAQEAEANGLDELIYTDENGNKAVDYTSLLILKIGFLENEIKLLRYRLNKLDGLN